MAILISGTTNDITINGASVATDAEVSSAVAPLATTAYVDGKMVLSTAITASGTAVDFTSIPSWVKRITVMFNGVSTNGASSVQVQLGSGSVQTSGYAWSSALSIQSSANAGSQFTTGFGIVGGATSSSRSGMLEIFKESSNNYVASASMAYVEAASGISGGGSVTLSGTLDRLRVTTVNGADVFDAGKINIMYEG